MARTVGFTGCEAVAETDLALCIAGIHDEDVWVPKSQIDDDSEVWRKGDEGELIISEWFAEKEGLV